MQVINCQQGTDEWFAAKLGIPSASNFDKIVTGKGAPSKQAEKYMYRLAGEKISGKSEETYQNAAMERGIELEAEARNLYQVITDEVVDQVGFIINEGAGCSPDGLVGKKGGLEIKCPNMATHIGYLMTNKLPSEYFQQVQGQMYVAELDWVDFMSYYPGIRPFIIRVERDVPFIDCLDVEIKMLCNNLEEIVNKLK